MNRYSGAYILDNFLFKNLLQSVFQYSSLWYIIYDIKLLWIKSNQNNIINKL